MAIETDWFEFGAQVVSNTLKSCASQLVTVRCGAVEIVGICGRPERPADEQDEEREIDFEVTRLDWVFQTADLVAGGITKGFGVEVEWTRGGKTRVYKAVQRGSQATEAELDAYQIDTVIHTVLKSEN